MNLKIHKFVLDIALEIKSSVWTNRRAWLSRPWFLKSLIWQQRPTRDMFLMFKPWFYFTLVNQRHLVKTFESIFLNGEVRNPVLISKTEYHHLNINVTDFGIQISCLLKIRIHLISIQSLTPISYTTRIGIHVVGKNENLENSKWNWKNWSWKAQVEVWKWQLKLKSD